MKKIILSLSVVFATGMASAQSYIKQPDRTVYQVVEYTPAKKAEATQETTVEKQEEAKEEKAEVKAQEGTTTKQEATATAVAVRKEKES